MYTDSMLNVIDKQLDKALTRDMQIKQLEITEFQLSAIISNYIYSSIYIFKFLGISIQRMSRQYLLITYLFLLVSAQTTIFIEYGQSKRGEGRAILELLNDTPSQQKFYVDIGAYDPIHISNTLNLHTNGWKGINIEANPSRFSRFLYVRPNDINVNYAIGQDNKFVTLHEFKDDSVSTISNKVEKLIKSEQSQKQDISVPAITMGTLCHNYYLKRPKFLTLDIEGYGSQALMTNDWNKVKCRPEIILAQNNRFSKASGFPEVGQVLQKNNYTKLEGGNVGQNQFYISNDVFIKYQGISEKNKNLFKNQTREYIRPIMNQFASKINKKTQLFHYNIVQDDIYYHFSVEGEWIISSELIKKSQQFYKSPSTVRPIVIFHFNPKLSHIAVDDTNQYSQTRLKIGRHSFFNITIKTPQSYSIFVYNHQFSSSGVLEITGLSKSSKKMQSIQQKETTSSEIVITNPDPSNLKSEDLESSKIEALQAAKKQEEQLSNMKKQLRNIYETAALMIVIILLTNLALCVCFKKKGNSKHMKVVSKQDLETY